MKYLLAAHGRIALAAAALIVCIALVVSWLYRPSSGSAPSEESLRVLEKLVRADRIRFEPGSEALASEVACHLCRSVERAEQFHGLRFKFPVRVRVFATVESFVRESGASPKVRAASRAATVYVSPRLAEEIETTPAILVHELSHALLTQHVGLVRSGISLPAWFEEGLATLAAGGGGAEGVDPQDAVDAIRAGRTFVPETSGLPHFPQSASDYGLKPRMFYRQASLFVQYLRDTDPVRFHAFLDDLAEKEFAQAFADHFGRDVPSTWKDFLESLAGAFADAKR